MGSRTMSTSDLILLALDNEQLLQLFERSLTAVSYRVTIALDRVSLDKALQNSSPALVIIADQFSGGTGLDVSNEIIDRFPTMPVLFFAAHESNDILRNAMKVGI